MTEKPFKLELRPTVKPETADSDAELLEEVGEVKEEETPAKVVQITPVPSQIVQQEAEKPKEVANYGRPLKFQTVEELEAAIERYFDEDMPKREVVVGKGESSRVVQVACPTIAGLALYLGFVDRHSMYDYEKRPEFSHAIKNARARMEENYEVLLQTGLGAGAIFALKNFGWKDRTEVDNDPDNKIADALDRVRKYIPD